MYGLELVKEGEGELKRGTVYVTLGRMTDRGTLSRGRRQARQGSSRSILLEHY